MDLTDPQVLYVDPALLVVDKPPGLPVHATLDRERDTLERAVLRWLTKQGQTAELGLAHRLDVGTSGLVVLGRTREMTAKLVEIFAQRQVQKLYLALTSRLDPLPESPLEVRNHLAANRKREGWPVIAVHAGGDRAWTTLTQVQTSARAVLWQAELHTGRRHQIRAHLAGLGMPIVGDLDYDTPIPASRPMLHAFRLSLPHPQTGQQLDVQAPLPTDFVAVARRLGLVLPD